MNRAFLLCTIIALPLIVHASTITFKGYTFEAYVISDNGNRFSEIYKNGAPYLQVWKDAEYSIVVRNPLPVRVAVAVSIDGLNVIDGKRTTPDKSRKWMIDAHSSITLRGWQTERSSLRRFVFTDKGGSYAEWKGKRDDKNYTRNLGVIGAAFFWNSAELETALRPFEDEDNDLYSSVGSKDHSTLPTTPPARAASRRPIAPECALAEPKEQAGTGMGNLERNNVTDVAFHYTAGMFHTRDVLTIYYEFARDNKVPRPFDDDGGKNHFTPEMP